MNYTYLLLLLFFINLNAQFQPISKFYSHKDYDASLYNDAITQDKHGFMYFANAQGLLRFDGSSWELQSDVNLIRAMKYDSITNRIYVGRYNDFGYFQEENGSYNYTSLKPETVSDQFGYIWKIVEVNGKIYYQSTTTIFIYDFKTVTTVKSEKRLSWIMKAGNRLLINQQKSGLVELKAGKFTPIKNGRKFSMNIREPFFILPYGKDSYLLSAAKQGLFLLSKDEIIPFKTEITEKLTSDFIYTGIQLKDKTYLYYSFGGRIFNLSPSGSIISEYQSVLNGVEIFEDKDGNIWICSKKGITLFEQASPIRIIPQNIGLVFKTAEFKNIPIFATDNGAFYLSDNKLNKIENIGNAAFDILIFDNYILISNYNGVHKCQLKNGLITAEKVHSPRYKNLHIAYSLKRPSQFENTILIGSRTGLHTLINVDGNWKYHQYVAEINEEIFEILEDDKQQFWLKTKESTMLRFKISKHLSNNIILSNIERIPTDQMGIKLFEELSLNTFIPPSVKIDKSPENSFVQETFGTNIYFRFRDNKKNLWIASPKENQRFSLLKNEKLFYKPFSRMNVEYSKSIYIFQDSIALWGSVNEASIAAVNLNEIGSRVTTYNSFITQVSVQNDSVIHKGALQANSEIRIIDFENNSIKFKFTAPYYEGSEAIRFQSQLKASNKVYTAPFSNWKKENWRSFQNLGEGSYTFTVRAKNICGTISETASYTFTINSPWYRSVLMWFIYLNFLILIIYIITQWRNRKLLLEKERLESLVSTRTATIEKQNKQLIEQANSLSFIDKMKSDFFANISHEFRTPLTLILGPAEQLYDEERDPKKKRFIESIIKNGQSVLKHINQLLDISKIESGELKLNLSHGNVTLLIQRVIGTFSSLFETKQIRIDFSQDEFFFNYDSEKMDHIITNLLSNAIKFSENDAQIDVELNKTQSNDLIIKIKDHGIGIPESDIQYIFNRFYQVKTNDERYGTGIGLSLVKDLVELHQGQITVQSILGEGTIFEVYIPHIACTETEVEDNNFELTKTEAIEIPFDTQKELLLLVEDNNELVDYIHDSIHDYFNILIARNGEEGIELALKHIPDIILSDVMMPKKDGIELTNALKSNTLTNHIPIVLLTAKSQIEDKIKGLTEGADDYLAKPFHLKELITRLKNLTDNRRLLREKYAVSFETHTQTIEMPLLSKLDQKFLEQANQLIESQLSNADYSKEDFCSDMAVSRAQLYRKMKAITNLSPSAFIRNFRLEKALELIKEGETNITSVSIEVGFNSLSYFTKSFRERYGKSPKELMK